MRTLSVAAGGLVAWLVAALGLLSAPATAAGAGAGELLRCVQARYGAFRDLSADFAQESRVASLGRPRSRSGRLYLQRPGRMRWEYAPPEEQLIVADGKQLWIYRPERKQALVQAMDDALVRQTPFLFLLGKGDFATEFTWEERLPAPAAGGTVRLSLRPRREAPDLALLELEIVPGECRLAATRIEDAFGNVTRLSFSRERADAGLDAGLFRFTPPPGAEIVRP